MPFPTNNISADSIRNELAVNNTGGAQTPVTLNDTPVRAATNRPSGTVSLGDLSGINVLYSGLITFGGRSISPSPGNNIVVYGFSPNFPPTFGGPIGSLNTTSYYRMANGSIPLNGLAYDQSSGVSPVRTTIAFVSPFTSFPVSTFYVNLDTTRYTLTPYQQTERGWNISGDPLGLLNKSGQTYQVVITYV